MKNLIQNVLWLLCFLIFQILCSSKKTVTIGVLLNDLTSQVRLPLNSVIYKKNMFDQKVYFSTNISLVSNTDSFEASRTLCDMMNSYLGVAAVFVVDSPNTIPILESVCTNFEIPFIMTSWRSPVIRNPTQERALLSFYPEAERFAAGFAEIVKSLQWSSFVIVYEDEEGLIRMQDILKLQEYKRDTRKNNIFVKQLGPGPDYRQLLKEIKNTTVDSIILDCKTENILPILLQAKSINMLNLYNRFLITSLNAHTIDFSILNTTANITIMRLHDPNTENFENALVRWKLHFENHNISIQLDQKSIKTETLLFHDAILLLTDSISDLSVTPGIDTEALSCSDNQSTRDGFAIRNYMRIKSPSVTLTGPLEFNKNGDRIKFNIYAVDVMENTVIATYYASNKSITLARSGTESMDAAAVNLQKVKVIVSSRIGPPYLMLREPHDGEEYVGNRRYEGYSMDLIDGIAKIIGFNYEFRLTKARGSYDEATKRWDGLIAELLEKRAHLAVCDLTITPERREVVDFSMPFMTLGISILYKNTAKKEGNMFAFLEPFADTVWMYTATLYLIISLVLYFISRMTPGDWENPHPCEDEPEELENIWDIKNCLWLTLGSIMTQGCDILPKGISSRMAVAMWWFFSLIMTSSYTANLAAFLTKANMEPAIDGAEALSKQTRIKYGVLEGGSTKSFFKTSNYSVYQRMWVNMQQFKPSVFEKENEDGVNRVNTTKNNLYAFLMESTQIEYVVETECNLRQIGNWLDLKSYGIAMPINSPYRTVIDRAVLTMQESGELGNLKKKWWKEKRIRDANNNCTQNALDDADAGKLLLGNVGGVFLVLGVGVAMACVFAILEFLWNVRNITVEEHVSYWDALKVEMKFACKVWITKKRTRTLLAESSSSSIKSDKSDKTDNRSMVHSILNSAASFTNLNNRSKSHN